MNHSHSPLPTPRTLSIGGANYDLFIRADESLVHDHDGRKMFSLPLGNKIRINDALGLTGGGAANTSVGLSRLGCDASFCGVIGDDEWGTVIFDNLKKEKVHMALATIVDEETTSFSLVMIAGTGERVILNHPGTARHLRDVTFDKERAADFEAVFLNHIHKESCEIENDLIEIFQKHPKMHVSWNPGGRQIEAGITEKNNTLLVAHTSILFLNKEEALAFTGAPDIEESLRFLHTAGSKIVCITDGANGSYATDGKNRYFCASLPCEVVDATGAGDAFGTGVTWAILRGKDLKTALKAGTINAMSVVGVIGAEAGLLTQTQMHTSLDRTQLTVTVDPF